MIEKKNTYLAAKNNLDQIIEQVRSKDLPLEKALDLYEEAIRIGNSCADLIDKADFSMEEMEAYTASTEGEASEETAGADDAAGIAAEPESADEAQPAASDAEDPDGSQAADA